MACLIGFTQHYVMNEMTIDRTPRPILISHDIDIKALKQTYCGKGKLTKTINHTSQ